METPDSARPDSRGRGMNFALAVVGSGAFTLTALAGGAVLALVITGSMIAGTSARCAASPHRAHPRTLSRMAPARFANGWSRGDSGESFWYALVAPGGETLTGSTDTDSWSDLRREIGTRDREVLWVRIDRADYVIRDPATLDRAHAIVRPMEELGEQQGRLGEIQSALGRRQALLGEQQARIGARQAALAGRLTRLALGRGEDRDDSEPRAAEREMEELSRRQDELARRGEPLARQQDEFGRRQEEMGRQQQRLSARAAEEMRRLADQSIAAGRAARAN